MEPDRPLSSRTPDVATRNERRLRVEIMKKLEVFRCVCHINSTLYRHSSVGSFFWTVNASARSCTSPVVREFLPIGSDVHILKSLTQPC
jgi:hypothetical protein